MSVEGGGGGARGAPLAGADIAARDKLDQIIRACFLKTVEVILHARVLPFTNDLRRSSLNRTFNLELVEIEAVRRELSGWDSRRPLPLFIDIFLDLEGGSAAAQPAEAFAAGAAGARPARPAVSESVVLIERWQLLYLPSTQSMDRHHQALLYKRCGVLLRSLHARLRLMPAHRLAHRLAKKRATSGHGGHGGGARGSATAADMESDDFAMTNGSSDADEARGLAASGSASSAGADGEQHQPPAVRVHFAVQLGEGEHARPVWLADATAGGGACSQIPPASASFPSGACPLELSLPPMDQQHGQFHVSAFYCSEKERALKHALIRSSLAAVAMHTHGTIIADYIDTVQSPPAALAAARAQHSSSPSTPAAHAPSQPSSGARPPSGAAAVAPQSGGSSTPSAKLGSAGRAAQGGLGTRPHGALCAQLQAAASSPLLIGAGTSPPFSLEAAERPSGCGLPEHGGSLGGASAPSAQHAHYAQLAQPQIHPHYQQHEPQQHARLSAAASPPVAIPFALYSQRGGGGGGAADSAGGSPGAAGSFEPRATGGVPIPPAQHASRPGSSPANPLIRTGSSGSSPANPLIRTGSSGAGGLRDASPQQWTHPGMAGLPHARTPPQAVPVSLSGSNASRLTPAASGRRGAFDDERAASAHAASAHAASAHAASAHAAFQPIGGLASSPPLFGASPLALASAGSPVLLPTMLAGVAHFSAYAGQPRSFSPALSSSAHDQDSNKGSTSSSHRGSPFSARLAGDGLGAGGGGGFVLGGGAYGARGAACGAHHQLMAIPSSSAPAGGFRPLPASQHGGFGDDLDAPAMLEGSGMLRGDASSLSRSVVALSRDLDALRMSLNLGAAPSADDDELLMPGASRRGGATGRRTSLDSYSCDGQSRTSYVAASSGTSAFAQPLRGAGSSAADFDVTGLIFPFAPVCHDHCSDE